MTRTERIRAWWAGLTNDERRIAALAVAFLASLGLLTVAGSLQLRFLASTAALAGMYILLSLGLNIQWGYAGLVNFSVVAFWGIGAYSAALLTASRVPYPVETHPILGLLVGMLLAAVVAVAIGIPTLRLRADYLAIATLGFAEIFRLLMLNEAWLTRGGLGITGIPTLVSTVPGAEVLGELLDVQPRVIANVIAVGILVVVVFGFLRRTQRSPWGRVLRTIRADEDLGKALGKNTFWFKMQAFVLGSVVMAMAGAYFIHMNRLMHPTELFPLETFFIWIAVILGGSGSNRGAVIGGVILVLILQGTRFLNTYIDQLIFFTDLGFGPVRLFLIGALVILVIRYRPDGILPPQREHIWPEALTRNRGDEP